MWDVRRAGNFVTLILILFGLSSLGAGASNCRFNNFPFGPEQPFPEKGISFPDADLRDPAGLERLNLRVKYALENDPRQAARLYAFLKIHFDGNDYLKIKFPNPHDKARFLDAVEAFKNLAVPVLGTEARRHLEGVREEIARTGDPLMAADNFNSLFNDANPQMKGALINAIKAKPPQGLSSEQYWQLYAALDPRIQAAFSLPQVKGAYIKSLEQILSEADDRQQGREVPLTPLLERLNAHLGGWANFGGAKFQALLEASGQHERRMAVELNAQFKDLRYDSHWIKLEESGNLTELSRELSKHWDSDILEKYLNPSLKAEWVNRIRGVVERQIVSELHLLQRFYFQRVAKEGDEFSKKAVESVSGMDRPTTPEELKAFVLRLRGRKIFHRFMNNFLSETNFNKADLDNLETLIESHKSLFQYLKDSHPEYFYEGLQENSSNLSDEAN